MDGVQGVDNHHGRLWVPVFGFLLYKSVVAGVNRECLVQSVSFYCGVDCACGSECPVCNNLAECHCCVVLGLMMFMPHAYEDAVCPKNCLFRKVTGLSTVLMVLSDEGLVFARRPCLRDFVFQAGCSGGW